MGVHKKKKNIQNIIQKDFETRDIAKNKNKSVEDEVILEKEYKKEKMVLVTMRLGENHKKALIELFRKDGLELGTGIRTVLYNHLREKNIFIKT